MGFSFCDLVSASALESPRFSFPPNGITFPPPHQARSAATSFPALPLIHPAAHPSVPGGGNRPIIMTSNVRLHAEQPAAGCDSVRAVVGRLFLLVDFSSAMRGSEGDGREVLCLALVFKEGHMPMSAFSGVGE